MLLHLLVIVVYGIHDLSKLFIIFLQPYTFENNSKTYKSYGHKIQ